MTWQWELSTLSSHQMAHPGVVSHLCSLFSQPKGVLAVPLGKAISSRQRAHAEYSRLFFSLSFRLPICCSGHVALAVLMSFFMTVFCGSIALVVRSLVRLYFAAVLLWWYAVWYGSIDATPATQLLSNPQLRFVGTVPSTGRPGWSNKGYSPGTTRTSTCQGSGRSPVRLLATLSTVGWSVAGAPVWAREHLVGLCTEHLVGFWSACPPSVCPAPEGLLGLCKESLGRGRHVPAPGGRDVGSNAVAPTQEPVQGDPRNGSHLLEVYLCLSLAVSPLLGSLPGCSWRL